MFALKLVNDIWMVQINGKMLIASSRAMVGAMNSHAMPRSDMPRSRVLGPAPAATGTAVSSLMSTLAFKAVTFVTLAVGRVMLDRGGGWGWGGGIPTPFRTLG